MSANSHKRTLSACVNVWIKDLQPGFGRRHRTILESTFDTARLESQLVELLEKVDRLEQLQIQQQTSVPDPSVYLFFQNEISRQIDELDHRLQALSTNQRSQQSVTIAPDAQRSIRKPTQIKHDQLSPERKQDEKSSDRISLPRIIPKGTPW